ncbi:MAG: hypothetical protein HOP36_02045 [Methyloglobulus sp.]|nr:hypothetical protein [Methyloglobulus sp.]
MTVIEHDICRVRCGLLEVFDTDQSIYSTRGSFTGLLLDNGHCHQHGRAIDNIFVERFWWTDKYVDLYLQNTPTCQTYC